MKFELQDSFLTGHPGIDEDHRLLVEAVNLIGEAIADNEIGQCRRLLDSFVAIARGHFSREEAILRAVRFPGVDKHCEYHDGLLERAGTVRRMCRKMVDRERLKTCFEEMSGFMIDDIIEGDHIFVSYLTGARQTLG